MVLFAGVTGAAIVAGVYLWQREHPIAIRLPQRPETLKPVPSRGADFDLAYQLPGSPLGIASNGKELMIAARTDPWGVIRLTREDYKTFRAKKIPILETRYQQRMSLDALTWNGTHYVGYTTAAWFERSTGRVFTVHDPNTMKVVSRHPAPDLLGCIAWNGQGYWAATRNHTADSPEPAHLYFFDREFRLVETLDSPGVGCQGLAWDGRHLWMADVFSDAIYVVDVADGEMRVVHRAPVELTYLSGVVFFERAIWITDYDDDRLHRIRPATRAAWSGGAVEEPVLASVMPVAAPQPKASRKNSFFEEEAEDTDIVEWSIEIRDDGLWGSWTFWFGHDLFIEREQTSTIVTLPVFARYTLTVKHPDGREEEQTFDATPGENVMNDVHLADASEPGEYRVDVFMHVQYISAAGEARILNNSPGGLEVTRAARPR